MSLLKGILKAVQSLDQHEHGSSSDKFISGHRNCRTFLVNHVLTDLSKNLSGQKASGEFEIALSFLEHCREPPVLSGIFHFSDPQSKDFAVWLQSRLVRIYAAPTRTSHHAKTLSVHSTILEVILEDDALAFADMTGKLIQLLEDIHTSCEAGKPFQCAISTVDIIKPQTSDPLLEQSMKRVDVEVSELVQVQLLQSCIMKLLGKHIHSVIKHVTTPVLTSLVTSICWHIEYSGMTIKASTCELLSMAFTSDALFEAVNHAQLYNLLACVEVVALHALRSTDERLQETVAAMLTSLSRLPSERSTQLSMMLMESITDSTFSVPDESPAVTAMFDLLLSSASTQSIISMAMNKLLTDWIINQIQAGNACESMVYCLGDLLKHQKHESRVYNLGMLKRVLLTLTNSDIECEVNTVLMVRHCCHVLAHVYLNMSVGSEFCKDPTDDLSDLLTSLVSSWRKHLAAADGQLLTEVYIHVVESISSLLALSDVVTWNGEITTALLFISSLPWLHTPKMDLDKAVPPDLTDLAVSLKPLLTDHIVTSALSSISLYSRELSPNWRISILSSVAATRRTVPLAAIAETMPWLISRLGQTSLHLIYDLLHPLLSLQSSLVDESLARTMGCLSCIAAGTTQLKWLSVPTRSSIYSLERIYCEHCDGEEELTSHSVDPGMFEPYMQLIFKDSDDIRYEMARSVSRLFSHLKITYSNGETMSMLQTTLKLISDPCKAVRVAFSSSPHRAFSGSSMEVIGQFVDKILSTNTETEDEEVKETLIMTVFSLGKLKDENLLPICIRFLVESYLSTNESVSAAAFTNLLRLAEYRGLSPTQTYQHNQSLLAECLSEKVVEILSRSYSEGSTVMDLFHNASRLFHYESPAVFLRSLEKHIVPFLITSSHAEIPKVLRLLAGQVGKTYQQLFTSNMQYVFSHLVRFCDRPTFEQRIAFLESESRLTIGSLLRRSFQGVLQHLLLYIGCRQQQIRLGLTFFMSQDGQTQLASGTQVSDEQLAEFVERQFLGVLVYFDQTLLQKSSDLKKKELVISSLIQLIKLLGIKRVTQLKVKISTSLKLALATTTGNFPKLCCEAWLCFVQHVEVTALKPMLSFIIVTLLPLVRTLPEMVAQVLKYLVITCKKQLSSSFNELYFVPDIPELGEVNAVLKRYVIFSGRPDAFPLQLKQYLAGVDHENSEVSKQALSKLRQLLTDHKGQLHQMTLGAETVDPLITETMLKLTSSRMKADDEMKLLYADCLAELGAIDPGKMMNIALSSPTRSKSSRDLGVINSPAFTVDYIEVLVTALLSAETTPKQDCIALAIQGALTLFDVKNSESNEIWKSLSSQTQDILPPYLESKYTIADRNWLKVDSPVYNSSKGTLFTDWLCNWTALLASKVADGFARELFGSNMAAISASVQVAMFILPYIIAYVLAEDKDSALVSDEIRVVVEEAQTEDLSQFCHMALQTIFSVFDEIKAWINEPKQATSKDGPTGTEDVSLERINKFMDDFPHDTIARASLNCKSYARCLLHYEQHMAGDSIHEHLDTLQEIYAAMGETDGVSGVDSIREKPATLHQQAVVWENVDKLRDAMVCYEEAININPTDLSAHEGLMKCYLNLGNWYQALSHSPVSLGADNSLLHTKLLSYKVEAAWKLGNWNILKEMVGTEAKGVQCWGVGVGRLLLAGRDGAQDEFNEIMSQLKKDIIGPLCAASMKSSSLQRAYPYLVQLHMLNDIEAAAKLCLFRPEQKDLHLQALLNRLDTRFSVVQASMATTEPLVTLRQSLLLLIQEAVPQANLTQRLQKCWLTRASIARQANQLSNAYGSLEKAARYGLAEREVEKAKLFWHRGDGNHAQTCLARVINSHYDKAAVVDVHRKSRADQLAHAEVRDDATQSWRMQLTMLMFVTLLAVLLYNYLVLQAALTAKSAKMDEVYLLYAWYHEGDSKFERAEVMRHYKKAIELCPQSETGYFRLAVYYDKYLASRPDNQPLYWRVYKQTAQNYAQSVRHGSKNVYQSMSRAISLWLDLGSDIAAKQYKERLNTETKEILKHQQATLALIHTECIEPMKENAAGFQWLTVFSQLVSRLCHAHNEVTALLQDVIAHLIVQYPQQTVWNMMAISKSSFPIRLERCQEIFEKAKSKSPALHIFFRDINKLTDRLLELTNKPVQQKVYTLSLGDNFRFLKRLLDDPNFSEIMLPGQSAMTVTLPADTDLTGIPKDHNAFAAGSVYLVGFLDKVDVLSSMIRPKKLTMIGSDGKSHPFLCKPKDDLRKDGRLMEFNGIINKLLRKDAQSRRMQLYIKTYAVIPLNEECGLIEWINNTSPYRTILNLLYKEKGCYVSMTSCMNAYKAFHSKSPVDVRLPIFKQTRDKFPPILHIWFLRNFPDPTSWYNARVTYARTLAVMSVIGYIVGLGDRHGENILLDSATGGIMHVDFNCLFNKGLTFDWPEVVPFRLTHNMVAAMGPLGYEGIFKKAAEVTLRVMKQEKDQLMSILRPFIYDPLVEWSKPLATGKRKGKQQSDTGEVNNEQAMTHVQTIENRLAEGESGQDKGLWLSTEGHVQDLISEATDEKNLARMYVGWAAFF